MQNYFLSLIFFSLINCNYQFAFAMRAPEVQKNATHQDTTSVKNYKIPSVAIDTSQKLDQELWASEVGNLDYSSDYKTNQPNYNYNPPSFTWIERLVKFFQASATLMKFVLVALLLLLAYFVFSKFGPSYSNAPLNKKLDYSTVDLDEVEKNLLDIDLEHLLEQALKANDFKVAIRLYYIIAIKKLALKGLIQWKKDKTNGAYIQELEKHQLGVAFRKITLKYEKIWFGDSFRSENYDEEVTDFIIFKNLLENL